MGDHAGKAGRGVAANGAGDHGQQAVAPNDLAVHYKDNKSDTVSQSGGDHFEGIDLMQVAVAEERKKGNEEKASAGAKVADIKADENS